MDLVRRALFLSCWLWIGATAAAAASCVDYADHLRLLSVTETPGGGSGLQLSDNFVFCGDLDAGLTVVDVTNPLFPRIVATVDLPGRITYLQLQTPYLYVAAGSAGMHVVDVTDPRSPRWCVTFAEIPDASRLLVEGHMAFVADFATNALHVVDIHDPLTPRLLAGLGGIHVEDMVLAGDTLYVADEPDFVVVDVTDPTIPSLVSRTRLSHGCRGIVTHGNAVLVGTSIGVQILDVADPQRPVVVSTTESPSSIYGLDADGLLVYATGWGSLMTFDVVAPSRPELLGAIATKGIPGQLGVRNGLVFVGEVEAGLEIFDATEPSSVQELGSLAGVDHVRRAKIVGRYGYLAQWGHGLRIVDLGDPARPFITGSLEGVGPAAYALDVERDTCYLAAGDQGILVLSVSDPSAPALVRAVPTPGVAMDVVIDGSRLYVVDSSNGLLIFDRSDPHSPSLVGSIDPRSPIREIALHGHLVYARDADNLVQLIDAEDPAAPRLLDPGASAVRAWSFRVEGELAFGSYANDLTVYLLDDPSSPRPAGTVTMTRWCGPAVLRGSVAYVPVDKSGVHMVDVTDPFAPRVLGTTIFGYIQQGVVLGSDFFVTIANAYAPLVTWPFQCGPAVAVLLEDFHAERVGREIDVSWTCATWHAESEFRLVVSDGSAERDVAFRDLGSGQFHATLVPPEPVCTIRLLARDTMQPSGAEEWSILAERTFEAAGTDVSSGIRSVSSSPADPRTVIRFELLRAVRVRLEIVDLAGRKLGVLTDEVYEAGEHTIVWDGRDQRGREVGAGVLMLRGNFGGRIDTRKIVCIR